jgi:pimeloyl-ACP methyl ester carboxylesterase
MARIQPFTIAIEDEVLDDLRARIRATRWPDQIPGAGWTQGTELGYLQDLLAFWADGFDWRAQEHRINRHRQLLVDVDGVTVHCVHERAPGGNGIPLILSHGWPSCFVELLSLVPLLTDPAVHGIDGPAFDVVIPSLLGYGFTPRPPITGVTYRYTARLWHALMRGLGYQRYGAGGGDFGAGVATYMALEDPDAMIGIHLTTPELEPYLGTGSPPLSPAEERFVAQNRAWSDVERGYSAIQSTKPQTVGYGLTDSPAGLAAWLMEKWRSWSDSGGDLDRRFGRDFLLTLLTVYWVTDSITPSMRDYFDNRFHGERLGPDDVVRVPTGIAAFDHHFVPEGEPPREWSERLYSVRRWTRMPRGGHFAAGEEPELVAADLAAFFGDIAGDHMGERR